MLVWCLNAIVKDDGGLRLTHSHNACKICTYRTIHIIEGNLNSKLPTIWTVEKQIRQAVKSEVKRCSGEKVRRKKIHPRQMLEKSRNAVLFQWFVCRVSPKVGLLKRRVRRYLMSKNCTPLWRKAHYQVKMLKNCGSRSTFWSSDVEKLHAAVAKSTLSSQNVKKLSFSEHFLKFWCRKIARRCGEKHIIKSKCKKKRVLEHFLKFWCRKIGRRCGEKHILKWKCTKNVSSGQFFEVLMSKN